MCERFVPLLFRCYSYYSGRLLITKLKANRYILNIIMIVIIIIIIIMTIIIIIILTIINSLFTSEIDCSQSPIFSWDRLGIPRLTATAILIFKCTEGAGVGDYSSRWRGGGRWRENRPRPLSSFDTHARWQPVTQSARSRRSYGKIEDCEQSTSEKQMRRLTRSCTTPTLSSLF